ncbi:type II toxin-antitoxin system VapC family toxin [Dyadobacter luteus]|uniref:Type II toxin-antitoxin system VapC family toxin n=1 Tax=Dyadobacter luteus TaxID=2259619 RepID=A0A3D8Y403_9BACT|nr:type II toxin-antitoxin system VapC family toxin [Dyadobacter luteus]REA56715.1 type II toxin-antitoxin system VapC family toxin [Dyadobacter luteus]
MGIKYLWDTNTSIYYLQQQFPLHSEKLIDNIVGNYKIAISAITEIELYCWKYATPEDLIILHEFVKDSVVIELEKEIKFKTAELRKAYKIKLPDAIIAATSIVYNLILITRNVKDFSEISELKILNPYEV